MSQQTRKGSLRPARQSRGTGLGASSSKRGRVVIARGRWHQSPFRATLPPEIGDRARDPTRVTPLVPEFQADDGGGRQPSGAIGLGFTS
jgi:hypothetical protein